MPSTCSESPGMMTEKSGSCTNVSRLRFFVHRTEKGAQYYECKSPTRADLGAIGRACFSFRCDGHSPYGHLKGQEREGVEQWIAENEFKSACPAAVSKCANRQGDPRRTFGMTNPPLELH